MKKRLTALLLCALALCSCQKQQTPEFFIDGELPETGSFSLKQDRYYDYPANKFIPSEQYGAIIPFIGRSKQLSAEGVGFTIPSNSYGICDLDGKIITDPSGHYSSMNTLYDDSGNKYYVLYGSPNEDGFSQSFSLISADGRLCLDFEGSFVSSISSNTIIVTSTDYSKSIAYTFDGEKIFEIGSDCGVGKFSHGLCPISDYSDTNAKSYYIDESGKRVSPIYRYINAFNSKGFAQVTDQLDQSFLINTSFEKVSEHYDSIYYAENDGFTAVKGNKTILLSDELEELASITSDSNTMNISRLDNGKYIYYLDSYYRVEDNSKIICKETGSDHIYVVNSYFVHTASSYDQNYPDRPGISTSYILDYDGNTLAVIENCPYISCILPDGLVVYDEDINDSRYIVGYNLNTKKEVFRRQGYGYTFGIGQGNRYYCISTDGLDSYDHEAMLYDIQSSSLLFTDLVCSVECVSVGDKDYFSVCTKQLCTLYDDSLGKLLSFVNE